MYLQLLNLVCSYLMTTQRKESGWSLLGPSSITFSEMGYSIHSVCIFAHPRLLPVGGYCLTVSHAVVLRVCPSVCPKNGPICCNWRAKWSNSGGGYAHCASHCRFSYRYCYMLSLITKAGLHYWCVRLLPLAAILHVLLDVVLQLAISFSIVVYILLVYNICI